MSMRREFDDASANLHFAIFNLLSVLALAQLFVRSRDGAADLRPQAPTAGLTGVLRSAVVTTVLVVYLPDPGSIVRIAPPISGKTADSFKTLRDSLPTQSVE